MPTPERMKEILLSKKKERQELIQIPKKNLLSSGFTPLDVHCTGSTIGGYGKGLFIYLVGDSSTGKTWLTNSCLAEACMNPRFDDYELVYDNVENGNLMNIRRFFGNAAADRWVPPQGTQDAPINSRTTQDFFYNLSKRLKSKKPCIYVIDSETALIPDQDIERFEENAKLREKGKKAKQSYGMAKAKENSDKMRMMVPLLEDSKSILFMIGQTRQNVGWGFEDRTRSGGLSLSFYAHLEFWTKKLKKIKKEVQGIDRHIGTIIEIDIRKNRLNGWEGKITMPFYKSYGIDNLGGCIDYLVNEKYWKKKAGYIHAEELDLTMKREALISKIQKDDSEAIVRQAVRNCFEKVQKACQLDRKPRYT